MPLASSPQIAATFDAARVAKSVRAIQQGGIGYAEFLRQIMGAGCATYRVFIGGRKAMYFGRDGDFHGAVSDAGRQPACRPRNPVP